MDVFIWIIVSVSAWYDQLIMRSNLLIIWRIEYWKVACPCLLYFAVLQWYQYIPPIQNHYRCWWAIQCQIILVIGRLKCWIILDPYFLCLNKVCLKLVLSHPTKFAFSGNRYNLKKLTYEERKNKLIERLNAFNSAAQDHDDDEWKY